VTEHYSRLEERMRLYEAPWFFAFCSVLCVEFGGWSPVLHGDCIAEQAPPVASAVSPDGRVRIELSIAGQGGNGGSPVYQVFFRDRQVVQPSKLGLVLADGSAFGCDTALESVRKRSINETYTQRPGKRSQVVDHCQEVVVRLREGTDPSRPWQITMRAYNEGVAVRYRIAERENAGGKDIALAAEQTQFRLPAEALGHVLVLNGYKTPHEGRYQHVRIADIPPEKLIGLPLLAELPGIGWLAIMEANLSDYAGMYLAREEGQGGVLATRLSPWPDDPKVAVRATLPHDSPWRALMITDKLERLIESDLVLNLSAPCALADTAWIHPGKTTFPWWNGFFEASVPFPMGLNTETAKYYIDFCAEAKIPYHSLDGKDNTAWYGGPIVPYQGADITRGIKGLDLQEVLRYAASKGVRIRLWMHWQAAAAHMDRAFPLFHAWGVEGVMLDFMDRDDQEMVKFLHRAIETAARNKLTVTLHGVSAPTGLERTYPNLLTSESVMNLEYDKWDKKGVTPDHELTVVFTRMLAGPLDFHQGSLRGVPLERFQPRNEAPLVIGTPCRMLASYVVLQNHLPMVADYPSAYRGHPLLPVLAAIPTTWDDTRCLAGKVGELIVVARRWDSDWWVGAMGGRDEREVEVPLSFLAPGRYRLEIYRDDLKSDHRFARATREGSPADVLRASLAPAGGLLIHITSSSPSAFQDRPDPAQAVTALERMGGTVFLRDGQVIEVNLNRTKISDEQLALLSGFPALTDLSLEGTTIGDRGLAHLEHLAELQWLNLYRTRVGNAGLAHLKRLGKLEHLPLGETRVSDDGLAHLTSLGRLTYLGLRSDAITDAGLVHVGRLVGLTGLHLGQTNVTDEGMTFLEPLIRLKSLWLHDTQVGDGAIPALARLKSLKDVYLERSHFTIAGVRKLTRALPSCKIYYRSEREPE
jgi:alpha-glucosidase